MAKVLISGGTGLIGQHLAKMLLKHNYDVAVLSRRRSTSKDAEIPAYHWDLDKNEIDREAVNTCDYIIHLAGVNIGKKRWTDQRKREIARSRIKSAELIFKNINTRDHSLKAFISASASGYYGSITSEQVFEETDPPAEDFLGHICKQWEQSADKFAELGTRVVKIRTGIVLSREGGALSRIRIAVKAGLGSALGTGNQYFPWIHMEDLCHMFMSAIENTRMKGPYNAVAPEHITNKEFVRKMAKKYRRPFWFPNVPAILLKLIFGEMSTIILHGSRISSKKIEAAGYTFRFPTVDSALQDLCK